jgi:hypothetical protein
MNGDIRAGLYMSHMDYDFKRNVYDRMSRQEREQGWGDAIASGLKNVQEDMDQLKMPVTWALYRVRSEA